MGWKPEFSTVTVELGSIPEIEATSLHGRATSPGPGQVWVFGFDFQNIAAWEVWMRLLEDSFPGHPQINLGYATGVAERRHLCVLDQCVPASRKGRTYLCRDPRHDVMKWGQFEIGDKVIVAILRHDGTSYVMRGLPSPSDWIRFEYEARVVLNVPAEPRLPKQASGT